MSTEQIKIKILAEKLEKYSGKKVFLREMKNVDFERYQKYQKIYDKLSNILEELNNLSTDISSFHEYEVKYLENEDLEPILKSYKFDEAVKGLEVFNQNVYTVANNIYNKNKKNKKKYSQT